MHDKPAVYNMRSVRPADTVYVGRPSKWGNPFSFDALGRERIVALFEEWVRKDPEFMAQIKKELRGKNLGCWCMPYPCHASVLLKIANEE